MPYWDITSDAGRFEEAYIFNSGLGGIGDIENDDCVDIEDDGAWSVNNFPLQHICHENIVPSDNPSNGCCLKRAAARGQDLSSISAYTNFVKTYNNFGASDGFRKWTFAGMHGEIHGFVGGGWDNYTHMISRYSSEDPLFYLLHSWLDYVFVVWKQCWGYDTIDSSDLDNYPAAYYPWPQEDLQNGIPSSGLDDKLYYVPMDDITWWEGNIRNPTARKMWKETDWNMQYERGTFIARSHLSALCSNDEWDASIILENSDETNAAIEILRAEDGESEVDRYQHKTWKYILNLMNDESTKDIYKETDYVQTWAAKTCNFQRQRQGMEPCYLPQEYEKCSIDDFKRKSELTLDELLKKEGVAGNVCLEEVRANIYPWAKSMDLLYEVCMGEFDEQIMCSSPKIDFMIDADDEVYYDKLLNIKSKMKQEASAKVITNDKAEAKENYIPEIIDGGNIIQNYPRFDVMGYLIVAFIIGGCAFIVMIRNCCVEYNSKLPNPHKKRNGGYGSMIEML